MTQVTEELKRTKETSLKQGKEIVIKKLNTLYNLLKPYSEIAKLIPDTAAGYDISVKDEKNNFAYINYHRNGADWNLKTNGINRQLFLNDAKICDSDYRYFTISTKIIQNINEEEIIKKVENKTIEMFQSYINRATQEINEYNEAFKSFQTKLSAATITNILEALFDANNEFKNTGNLDLIEIISGYITTLEDLLKGGE
jgi:hypothetical protein